MNGWMEKYREAAKLAQREAVDVMTAFAANIDVIYDLEDLDLEFPETGKDVDRVGSMDELKAALKQCVDRGENRERILDFDPGIEGGRERVGGQAAIMANFLANIGDAVIFYTPLLSEELAGNMNERILFPVAEDGFILKNVKDVKNTDQTKKNLIFQYSGEKSGRVIFSSRVPGFGPYFPKGVEQNFPGIDRDLDRMLLSGFHNVEGNREAKIMKAAGQLEKLDTLKHLEFVYKDRERAELVVDHIFPPVESIGLDGDEIRHLAELLKLEPPGNEPSLGEVFQVARHLLDEYGMERVHVHTYSFQATVTSPAYPVENEKVRKAMLYSELAAVETCGTGEFPTELELGMEDRHIHDLDDLEDFQDFFSLENFVETGIAEVNGYRIAAVPTIIHEEPKRLVGLGDVISAGAFTGEVK